jgi:hypothetical protein
LALTSVLGEGTTVKLLFPVARIVVGDGVEG